MLFVEKKKMDVIGEKYIKLIKLSFRKIYIGGVEIFSYCEQ